MKNSLIIYSGKNFDQALIGLFEDLSRKSPLFVWQSDKAAGEKFGAIGPVQKIFFGSVAESLAGFLAFIVCLPLFWALYLPRLYFFSRKNKIGRIICVQTAEKMLFAPLAAILKLGVIWIELPGARRMGSGVLRIFSKAAQIVVFSAVQAVELEAAGFRREMINNISLGINLNAAERQDNIFFNLAKADKPYSFFKNFTVGAVAGAADRRRLELLLQAAKDCVNIIPNLRLVIIGPTPENGNLNWLVKNMGIESRVWFVGEPKNLGQWFNDFDLYIALPENPDLGDLEEVLRAASHGVPVAVWPEKNLSEIIIENETGFVIGKDGAEALAQKIIEIEADQCRLLAVGEKAKRMVLANFERSRQVKRLEEIIDINDLKSEILSKKSETNQKLKIQN